MKNKVAKKFLSKIEELKQKEAQLVMTKLTGNFKRVNEHNNKHR